MSRRLVVAACLSLLGACSVTHCVKRGAELYGEGRYVEADEVFEHAEPRIAFESRRERAAYAAYRGATFVALGDLVRAQRWLTIASGIERARPGTMRAQERDLLHSALQMLNVRLRQTPSVSW